MPSKKRLYKKNLVSGACEVCGYDKYITRHRIRPGRKGGKYVPGNVIGLCPNCHSEAETGELSPHVLTQIVYDRIRRELKDKK